MAKPNKKSKNVGSVNLTHAGQPLWAKEGREGWGMYLELHMRDIQHISEEKPQYYGGVRHPGHQVPWRRVEIQRISLLLKLAFHQPSHFWSFLF